MSRRPDESAAQWYERAIVASSIAAAAVEELDDGPGVNPAARRAMTGRASAAAAELDQALEAFLGERRASRTQ